MTTEASTLSVTLLDHIGAEPVGEHPDTVELVDLVNGGVGGTGAFNTIMAQVKIHLQEEYEAGLITGDQYTKAYIELTTASLSTALEFVLRARQSTLQNRLLRSQEALAQLQLATEDGRYQMVMAQMEAERAKTRDTLSDGITPVNGLVGSQKQLTDAQINLVGQQQDLAREQTEVQRAQTMDTRLDNITPVAGVLGRQKSLYEQQVTSYQHDAEGKFGKMLIDSWITQKSLDEGLTAPNELTNISIDSVMAKLKTNLNL